MGIRGGADSLLLPAYVSSAPFPKSWRTSLKARDFGYLAAAAAAAERKRKKRREAAFGGGVACSGVGRGRMGQTGYAVGLAMVSWVPRKTDRGRRGFRRASFPACFLSGMESGTAEGRLSE